MNFLKRQSVRLSMEGQKALRFYQRSLFVVLKMNESPTGLERHMVE